MFAIYDTSTVCHSSSSTHPITSNSKSDDPAEVSDDTTQYNNRIPDFLFPSTGLVLAKLTKERKSSELSGTPAREDKLVKKRGNRRIIVTKR